MTKKTIIDDIELELLAGSVSDDTELSKSQIAYWVDVHINQVIANEINNKLRLGEPIPSVYIKKVTCQELLVEDDPCGEDRVYVELTDDILTLNNNSGIIKVLDEEGNEIQKASTEHLSLFSNMRFSKPSVENLQYTQEGISKIYFPGLRSVDAPFEQPTIWYVPKQDIMSAADSYEVLISDLSLPILIDMCVERGKRELYGGQQDVANDGMDVKDVQYHTAIRNPNNDQ